MAGCRIRSRRLSKLGQVQGELSRLWDFGRGVEGIVEPVGQVAVGEEVEPEHGGEVGQGPAGAGEVMEPAQQQQGDEGCPNLDAEGVLAGADEGADLEVLLEGLEPILFMADPSREPQVCVRSGQAQRRPTKT